MTMSFIIARPTIADLGKWLWFGFTSILPILISIVALSVVVYDRRPRLKLRARKGDWNTLKATLHKTEVIYKGIIEVYNVSSRANAIVGYEFWEKREGEDWTKMQSQQFQDIFDNVPVDVSNVTPFTLLPYSGSEMTVMAFTKMPQPFVMQVRVEVEDLFGKRYQAVVEAKS